MTTAGSFFPYAGDSIPDTVVPLFQIQPADKGVWSNAACANAACANEVSASRAEQSNI